VNRLYAGLVGRPYSVLDLTTRSAFDLDTVGHFGFHLDSCPEGSWLVGFGYGLGGRYAGWLTRRQLAPVAQPGLAWERGEDYFIRHLACDSLGQRFVTLHYEGASGMWLLLRDAANGEVLARAPVPNRTANEVLFNPNGSSLVVLTGMSLLVWDTRDFSRKPRKVKNTNRQHFTACAFHPSGRYLGAASNDASVKLFDTATWTITAAFNWEVGKARSLAFSPDGMLAAVGGDNGRIVIWDVDV
jgi:hypothetical protein